MTTGRIGVIVGLPQQTTVEQATRVRQDLDARFPGVRFAIVTGATSIWFPIPDDEPTA